MVESTWDKSIKYMKILFPFVLLVFNGFNIYTISLLISFLVLYSLSAFLKSDENLIFYEEIIDITKISILYLIVVFLIKELFISLLITLPFLLLNTDKSNYYKLLEYNLYLIILLYYPMSFINYILIYSFPIYIIPLQYVIISSVLVVIFNYFYFYIIAKYKAYLENSIFEIPLTYILIYSLIYIVSIYIYYNYLINNPY